jgi:hypothetical protein
LSFLLSLVLFLAGNRYLFTDPVREDADYAANSFLVDQAEHFRLLVGNYSRVGFSHPGPFLLYVAAAGQAVFHRLLHIVPADYNGQLLAWIILNALMVGLAVRTLRRITASTPIALLGLFVILAWSGAHSQVASAWFPYLYYPPFLLLGVAAAALLLGDLPSLPVFVFAGCVLVHGHVSFTMFVGVTTVAVVLAWALTHRRTWREELQDNARPVTAALVLLALFAVPLVVDLVLHWPGQWKLYYDYEVHSPGTGHSLGASLRYDAQFWSHRRIGKILLAIIGVSAVVAARTDPDRRRARVVLALLATAVLLGVLFLFYTLHGVDLLDQSYIGDFSTAIPALVLLAAGVEAGGRWTDRTNPRSGLALAVVAVVATLPLPALESGFRNPYRGAPYEVAMVNALLNSPVRAGRTVSIQFPRLAWPFVTGLVEQAHRQGLRVCLEDQSYALVFTANNLCRYKEAAGSYRITLVEAGLQTAAVAAPTPGAPPIWSDKTDALYPVPWP